MRTYGVLVEPPWLQPSLFKGFIIIYSWLLGIVSVFQLSLGAPPKKTNLQVRLCSSDQTVIKDKSYIFIYTGYELKALLTSNSRRIVLVKPQI